MRILLLVSDFPPARGGIQTWMHHLARDLPDAETRVLAPATAGDRAWDAASGLHVRRLGAGRWGRLAWLAQLIGRTLATCFTWRPDVIVCGHVACAPAALVARRLVGTRYVVFVYGWEIRTERRRHLNARLLRDARAVLACSAFTRHAALSLGVRPGRARIAHPGVDTDRFTPRADHRAATTLLSVSRLAEPYKGHDTAIRALPLVRARCPGARYVVAGAGPLRDSLADLADALGVRDAVEFHGDVADDALPELYRSADVLVLLARDDPATGGAEGFGIVCLEAAACGVPVVAGRSGGLPDAVEDGVTGILVPPDDPAAAADAIVALLTDPERARRMGAAGRARVVERFTWPQVLGEARAVLREAAGR